MSPPLQVALIAATSSLGVGVVGAILLLSWPRRSVPGLLVASGALGTLAVMAGVVATAEAMFLSGHDLGVTLLVCVVAGPVGLAVALLLGRQVVFEVALLRATARAISPDGAEPEPPRGRSRRSLRRDGQRSTRPRLTELAEVDDELVRTRQRLAAARNRERALEASRRELVAWVSHDLRTPLAGLRAMAEALEDGIVDDPSRYHRQIRVETDRLARMVDDLFELSRIQSGALTLSLQRVDVSGLVAEVVDGARPVATSLGVRLGSQVEVTTLDADPGGLSRVLANLVINAIRHTPSDGTVDVVAACDSADVVLTVTDHCGGLPETYLDRVFETGWRAEDARTPQPDGRAGLGLAIARGIVEAHHGRIHVENVEGGCRFVVRLPRWRPAG